jgi:hypothetical protein
MKHVKTLSHKRPALALGSIGLKALLAALFFGLGGND